MPKDDSSVCAGALPDSVVGLRCPFINMVIVSSVLKQLPITLRWQWLDFQRMVSLIRHTADGILSGGSGLTTVQIRMAMHPHHAPTVA